MKQKYAENLYQYTSYQSIPFLTTAILQILWCQHGTRIFFRRGAGGATANVSEKMFEVLGQNLHHILSRIL